IERFEYAEPSTSSASPYPYWLSLVDRSAGYDKDVALQEVFCIVPEGEGLRNSITVIRNDLPSLGCGCAECSAVSCFDYLPPTVHAISAHTADTDSKLHITITGDNFGINPVVLVGPDGAAPKVQSRGVELHGV